MKVSVLGFIECEATPALHLGSVIFLPNYGGLRIQYDTEDESFYEEADGFMAEGDYGFLAVKLAISQEEMKSGRIDHTPIVLGVVSCVEEGMQKYGNVTNGIFTLKDKYCIEEAVPRTGWAGTYVCSVDVREYYTKSSEWEMDLTPVRKFYDLGDEEFIIRTSVPRHVIEKRGITILGPDWINGVLAQAFDFEEAKESQMMNYYHYKGAMYSKDAARAMGVCKSNEAS